MSLVWGSAKVLCSGNWFLDAPVSVARMEEMLERLDDGDCSLQRLPFDHKARSIDTGLVYVR